MLPHPFWCSFLSVSKITSQVTYDFLPKFAILDVHKKLSMKKYGIISKRLLRMAYLTVEGA